MPYKEGEGGEDLIVEDAKFECEVLTFWGVLFWALHLVPRLPLSRLVSSPHLEEELSIDESSLPISLSDDSILTDPSQIDI